MMCSSCHESILLQSRPNEEVCPSCGSIQTIQLLGSLRGMTVNDLINLRNALKNAAYQPIIILKKAKFLLEQLYHLQKHFWIQPYLEMISNIPDILTSIEPFITSYLRDFVSRLRILLKHLDQNVDFFTLSEDNSYPNLGFEGALLLIQAESFMKAISSRLKPLKDSLNEIESIVSIFLKIQDDELQYLRKKFNFHVNELIITYFKDLSVKGGGLRFKKANLMLTTERILLFRKNKSELALDKIFLREEVIDSTFKKSRFTGAHLEIYLSDERRLIVKADHVTLNQIYLTMLHGWTNFEHQSSLINHSPSSRIDQIINDLKLITDHLHHYRAQVDHILKLFTTQKHSTPKLTNLTVPSARASTNDRFQNSSQDERSLGISNSSHGENILPSSENHDLIANPPFFFIDDGNSMNHVNASNDFFSSSQESSFQSQPPLLGADGLMSPYQASYHFNSSREALPYPQQAPLQRTLPEFISSSDSSFNHGSRSVHTKNHQFKSVDFQKVQYLQRRVQELRFQRDIYSSMLNDLKNEKSPLNLRERYELIAEYEKKIKEIDQELDMIYNHVE